MTAAPRGAVRSLRAEVAMFFAGVTWLWFGAVFYVALVVNALGCDGSCGGPGWRDREHAWQWPALLAVGAFAFAAGTAFVVYIRRRRPRAAFVAYCVGLAAAILWATAVSPSWVAAIRPTAGQFVFFLTGLFAPFTALLLIAEPRRDA